MCKKLKWEEEDGRRKKSTKLQEVLQAPLCAAADVDDVCAKNYYYYIDEKNRKNARRNVSTASLHSILCRFSSSSSPAYHCYLLSLPSSVFHSAPCKKHLVSFNNDEYTCDQYFLAKVSLKGRFSLITLIMNTSFHFVVRFLSRIPSHRPSHPSDPLPPPPKKKAFIETKQCGWGFIFRSFLSKCTFAQYTKAKLNVSVRIDNNLHNENSTRKYPHNYVRIS